MIRAIQFSNRRVGSTFLQNAIDSHTDIIGIDEVFVNNIRKGLKKSGFVPYCRFREGDIIFSPKEYINDVIHRTYPDTNTCFKLMYHQIHYHTGLYHYLTNGDRIKILHLMRKNLLKQVISFYKMSEYNHNPIKISPDQLFNEVVKADQDNKNWAKTFKNKIQLTLYFEDMIGKTEDDRTYLANNANVAVCNFFGVKQQQLFAKTKKKNKDDLSVYLPNIDKIRNKFKGTQYEWMMED
jgi:hypothetical protein